MISAISWIPKGVSKSEPSVLVPPFEKHLQELDPLQSSESKNEDRDVVDVQSFTVTDGVCENITHALKDLHMELYDDEDDGVELFSSRTCDLYYPSNDMDPYLKDKTDYDSEELEDMTIYPTDSVIVCARDESLRDESLNDEYSFGILEVWILEDGAKNMYRHHNIEISALPLCTAWLDCPLQGGERGNFLAVGSMEPFIEIWDLDVIEVDQELEPCMVLGGETKGKEKSIKLKDDGHTDSVLGLAWNKEYRNILASASSDKQVKIWDVVTGKCQITAKHHSGKVQAVAWNHHAPQVLLSGSFDQTVVMKDGRIPSHSGYKWSVPADVESLAWDPHAEHSFVVSLENGIVKCFDVRTAKSDSTSELSTGFTLHAHDEAVTSVSYNLLAPNLLATSSLDMTVKLWDLSNNQPSCVASYFPKIGAIHSISFSEDNPFFLAIGGSKKNFRVWNTLSDSGISQRYGNYNK